VIAGGWFLGQALAHAFGGKNETQTAQTPPTSVPIVTPLPSPSAEPTSEVSAVALATAPPSPSAVPSPSPAPTEEPTRPPTQQPAPSAQPTAQPTAQATAPPSPEPTRRRTPKPAPTPSAPPSIAPRVAAETESAAEQTVRAYIGALMRGDPQTAASYLGNGAPDESFINSQTRIERINETVNPDGSSNVDVLLQTTGGQYHETFQVAPGTGGNRILDKSATGP
jgi:hypothetical protein